MSRIAFRIISVELNNSTIHDLKNNAGLVRINLTERPTHNKQEYIIDNYRSLTNVNHEFNIDNPENKITKITMTLRNVYRSSYFSNLAVVPNMYVNKKTPNKDHSIDNYIKAGTSENRDDNVQCIYIEPKHSLIGYCTIKIKDLEVGVNNAIKVEVLSRETSNVVGYANLEIYIWKEPTFTQQKLASTCNEPILFVDPGCPTDTQKISIV